MANVVDWSLDSSSLRRNLLKLSKGKLIKACKYKKVSTNGSKQDMTERILNKSKQNKNRKLINKPISKLQKHSESQQQKQNRQILSNNNSTNIHQSYKQTEEIIIRGFIRSIESLFNHTKSIPEDIITLIIVFYKNTNILFCHTRTETTDTFDVCFTNHTNKKNLLRLHINEKFGLMSPHCYIPNASQLLINLSDDSLSSLSNNGIDFQHEKYDAILSYGTDSNNPIIGMFTRLFAVKSLVLILFQINDYNDVHDYFIFKSDIVSKATYCNSLLFCGEKHSIIGTTYFGDKLFQLKLQNVTDLNSLLFNQIDSNFCSTGLFPKTVYMNEHEKLFSMQCKSVWKTQTNVPQTWNCKLFDLNTNTHKHVKSYEFKHTKNTSNGMCYYENGIYFVSDMDIISKYDYMKNKWINLYENKYIADTLQLETNPVIWLNNPNVIFAALEEMGKIKLKCFDMRDNQKVKPWIDCYSPFIDKHINSYLFLSD